MVLAGNRITYSTDDRVLGLRNITGDWRPAAIPGDVIGIVLPDTDHLARQSQQANVASGQERPVKVGVPNGCSAFSRVVISLARPGSSMLAKRLSGLAISTLIRI